MQTKTKNQEKLDFKNFIPKDIQKVVDERGFYLYEWINFDELKESMKIFCLKMILKLSPYFINSILILIALGFFAFLLGGIISEYFINEMNLSFLFYFIIFLIGLITLLIIILNIIIFLTTLLVSIKRTFYFIKSSHIIITNNYISVLGKKC